MSDTETHQRTFRLLAWLLSQQPGPVEVPDDLGDWAIREWEVDGVTKLDVVAVDEVLPLKPNAASLGVSLSRQVAGTVDAKAAMAPEAHRNGPRSDARGETAFGDHHDGERRSGAREGKR